MDTLTQPVRLIRAEKCPITTGPDSPSSDLRMSEVEEVLRTLGPAMEADGGGVSLDHITESSVYVRLRGTCLACPSSGLTMKQGIEAALLKRLAWVREVHRVS
jgi:Fe-S cluster biogenesis protein NfuA